MGLSELDGAIRTLEGSINTFDGALTAFQRLQSVLQDGWATLIVPEGGRGGYLGTIRIAQPFRGPLHAFKIPFVDIQEAS